MKDLAGRSAFVTGAASGIGLGIARTFARAGMNLALADIQADALEAARAEVEALGARAIALPLDVTDADAFAAAAEAATGAFGEIHVLVNNAGVAVSGTPVADVRLDEWDWVIGVNLYGVIHGLRSVLPLIRAHGEGGHVVNTASIGGLQVNPDLKSGAYNATKYGVVAISEALANDLAGSGIGVSVLCPAAVNTRIYETQKHRPARYGGPFERPDNLRLQPVLEREGLDPDLVGERVVQAIREDELFVFTHTGPRDWIEQRHRRIMDAFDRAALFEEAWCRGPVPAGRRG